MKRLLSRGAALTTAAIILAGCTTLDPYTREERTSRATTGATIGAIAGAAIGIATGDDASDRRRRALIGAGIGGLSGGGVGYYMDQQENELRRQLEDSGVSVTRHGDNITLNMPGNITFGFDEASIQPSFTEVLDSVALVLQRYEKTIIEVAGHTDSTGSAAYNQGLSERRANAVANHLANQGVDTRRIISRGYGQNHPIANNNTEQGRAQNRRVELTLVPLTEN
ncbi:cell envelope biogenesis protein OmpA [Alkalilimnicola ehrlichii]|uniref:Cell envelope biogenesis protein OmpA n=1 Tax=Alkalilimnicola ehrlichii TaxID=351052 RepID=A0A3E0X1J9_9GAMM|nr:OmpA family protein [Alkalilimnicola ehrlichii]RFA31188.1 cell envelope biogenesis protein OmpA [Alkalilimnicola ehrlichii]RFA39529.1 cell envelope biogenesis protein OmpA [Alkalilimnicola ehrlichii]